MPWPRARLRPLGATAVALAFLLPLGAAPAASAAPPLSAPLELMIAPDTFIDELVPLKEWRESQGFRVDIVTTTSIQSQYAGLDFGEVIHKYLVARKSADSTLQYVLLVADDPIIPGRLLQVANRTAGPGMSDVNRSVTSDFYYGVTQSTFLNASDIGDEFPIGAAWWGISDDSWRLTPDLHVGRIPATDESEVARYVSRLLAWEQSPPAGPWQNRTVLGLGVTAPPNSSTYAADRLGLDAGVTFASAEAALASRGLTNIPLRDYPGWPAAYDPASDQLDDAAFRAQWGLGAGVVLLAARDAPVPGAAPEAYAGDGDTDVFAAIARPTDLSSLANGDKLTLFLAAYGSAANFTAPADSDMELAVLAPSGGAALAVGISGVTGARPGGTVGGWRMMSLVLDELTARPAPIGVAVDRARARLVADAQTTMGSAFDPNDPALRNTVAGVTILGDPASAPALGAHRPLSVTAPEGVAPNATSTFTVSVASAGAPVGNATVAVLDDAGELVGRAVSDSSGVAFITLTTGSRGNWTLVVSAAGYAQLRQRLAVDSPPSAVINSPGWGASVAGFVAFGGGAGDPDAGDSVTAVEVALNGGPWQVAVGAPGWIFFVDTTTLENGPNRVAARAFDGEIWGLVTTVDFVVTNPQPPRQRAPYPMLFLNEDNATAHFDLDLGGHFVASGPDALLFAEIDPAERVRAALNGSDLAVTPEKDFNGVVNVTMRVFDSYGGNVTVTLSLAVLPVSDIPVLTVAGVFTISEGGTVLFDVRAYDVDGTTPSVYLESAPSGAATDHWSPARGTAGDYLFVFAATDGFFIARVPVNVTVLPYNSPPVASLSAPARGEAGRELSFAALQASDADGDPLTFAWDFGDGQRATGAAPSHVYAAAGTFAVRLNVSDGRQTVTYNATVNVDPYRSAGTPNPGAEAAIGLASILVIALCAAYALYLMVTGALGARVGRKRSPPPKSATGEDREEE